MYSVSACGCAAVVHGCHGLYHPAPISSLPHSVALSQLQLTTLQLLGLEVTWSAATRAVLG